MITFTTSQLLSATRRLPHFPWRIKPLLVLFHRHRNCFLNSDAIMTIYWTAPTSFHDPAGVWVAAFHCQTGAVPSVPAELVLALFCCQLQAFEGDGSGVWRLVANRPLLTRQSAYEPAGQHGVEAKIAWQHVVTGAAREGTSDGWETNLIGAS